jgi:EAL domain-containing protein (putative c-di-GMP-specific phosphodiesterase class I)
MRWHKEGVRENLRVMVHLSDGEAWKALNNFDVDFASDARNVRVRLAIDDFGPFNTNYTTYSYWPAFVVS